MEDVQGIETEAENGCGEAQDEGVGDETVKNSPEEMSDDNFTEEEDGRGEDDTTEGEQAARKPRQYQSPTDEKLVAGRIHREEVREFWKKTLKADDYTMNVLAEGYKLPFKEGCTQQQYQEKNNKSAIKHMNFTIQETERWAAKKVVKEVFIKPTCVSPLTVAERTLGEEEKLRLCLDLSRYINLLLKKEPVKLAGIDVCTQALQQAIS